MTPDPSEVRSQGGMKAERSGGEVTLQHVVASFGVSQTVFFFSLIGRAICRSWEVLQGRFLPLKGSGQTGRMRRSQTARSHHISVITITTDVQLIASSVQT